MLHTSFWAVPAFMRVLPMSTSGPTTGQMATSTSSVNSSRGVQVTYTVRAPSERARAMALTTYGVRRLAPGPPPPAPRDVPRARAERAGARDGAHHVRRAPARREPHDRVLRSDLEVVHRLSALIGASRGSFGGAGGRGVAAGDDARDLVGLGAERGRALGGVEDAQPSARAGAHVDEPAAGQIGRASGEGKRGDIG